MSNDIGSHHSILMYDPILNYDRIIDFSEMNGALLTNVRMYSSA